MRSCYNINDIPLYNTEVIGGLDTIHYPANSNSIIIAAYVRASHVNIVLLCCYYAAIKCLLSCY